MTSKTFTTSALMALVAAALIGSTMTSAVSLATVDPTAGAETGLLKPYPADYAEGDVIKLATNFPSGSFHMSIYARTPGGEWAHLEPKSQFYYKKAGSTGNLVLEGYTVGAKQELVARTTLGTHSNVITIDPAGGEDPGDPGETSATLGDFTVAGSYGQSAQVKATFVPAKSGTSASLQAKLVNPQLEDPPVETWKTIATASQSSGGVATFTVGDPLEVKHEYRAVSNGLTTNTVEFSGQLLTKPTGLATFYMNTNDGDDVTSRDYYRKGQFAMKTGSKQPQCANSGSIVDPAIAEAQIKGRGNYSWGFPKKSFTLKLDKSTNLCGMGKSKKWALVANDYDKSLMRNSVAYELGKRFSNLGWSPDETPVDFYLNGSFRGSYMLVERIAATGDKTPADGGRIPITEFEDGDPASEDYDGLGVNEGGYVLEWDFRCGADHNFYVDNRGCVGLKEPEDEAYTSARYNFIHGYVEDADDALAKLKSNPSSTEWKNYIDMASAVDYYLAMEYLKPVDGNMWASVYMYKPPGGKLKMGPLWDFDLGEGSANRAGNVGSSSSWYLRNNLQISAMHPKDLYPKYDTWFNLLNKSTEFRTAHKARWNAIKGSLDMRGFITQRKALIGASADWNYKKWSHSHRISSVQVIKSSWTSDVSYLSSWMYNRRGWITSQF